MADPAEGDEEGRNGTASTENNGGAKRKVVRQPNRRQHEKDVQEITEQISAKEAELKSLGRPNIETSPEEVAEREALENEQKRVRKLKETTIAKRKEFDENLHRLSDHISKHQDALSRLKANLPHKTERAVDEAIHKLEYQLQTQHFKLRDEKRIVNEITTLRRSRKQIKEYQEKRMVLDADIRKRDDMKKERNIHFRKVSELKTKEDEIRQKMQRQKSKVDEAWNRYRQAGPERDRIKKEIDGLYEIRRQLTAEFQAQQKEFREYNELQRIENERRKDDERRAQEAKHKREWFEYEQSREPFEEERAQINRLMTYLKKLQPRGEGGLSPSRGSPQSGASPVPSVSSSGSPNSSLGRRPSFKDDEGTFTILKKKSDDDDDVFLQAASRKKRNSRRKSWLSKPLRHTREIFNQFAAVGLSAPSTATEISDVMEKLQEKLQYYEDAAASVKMAHSAIPNDFSTTSSISSGIVTATDFEDMLDSTEDEAGSTDDVSTPRNVAASDIPAINSGGDGSSAPWNIGTAFVQLHIREDVQDSGSHSVSDQSRIRDVTQGPDILGGGDNQQPQDSMQGSSIVQQIGDTNVICILSENASEQNINVQNMNTALAQSLDNAPPQSQNLDNVSEQAQNVDTSVVKSNAASEQTASSSSSQSSDDDKDDVKSQTTDTSTIARSESSGSNGSDDGREAGNVTDDSESTVVANDHENGQRSPPDDTTASGCTNTVQMGKNDYTDCGRENFEGSVVVIHGGDDIEDSNVVSIDRESDSGMDLQEGETRRGIAERKNETLRLIVSRSSDKDNDSSKTDLLTSSQVESSSDYASNSTGSAVSTPTDLAMLAKRDPPLSDINALSLGDPETVFQMSMEGESAWGQELSQGALLAHDSALHSDEEQAADYERL